MEVANEHFQKNPEVFCKKEEQQCQPSVQEQEREKELKRVHEVALMMCLGPEPLDRHERALALMELEEAGIGLPGVDL